MRAAALALMPCLLLAGCFGAARRRPYTAVANAAITAGADAKTAYQAAQDEYYSEQADQLAADYATKGYTPGQISALIASSGVYSSRATSRAACNPPQSERC